MRIMRAAAEAWLGADSPVKRDCCVFVLSTLTKAYDLPMASAELMSLWMIWTDANHYVPKERVWGPVVAAEKVGIAMATMTDPGSDGWYVCQGWSKLEADGRVHAPADGSGAHGHTWLWRAVGVDDIGIVYESSRDLGVRVSGFLRWSEKIKRYPGGVATGRLRPSTTLVPS